MPKPGAPALHHVAFACRDPRETHRFYGELFGLELVHTEVQRHRGGLIRHFFYDLGDGSALAFFELRGAGEPEPMRTAISTDLGLPAWVNHLALRVDPERRRAIEERLAAAGVEPAMTLDHGWCTSSYYLDPNGILVELCQDDPGLPRRPAEAERVLFADPESL